MERDNGKCIPGFPKVSLILAAGRYVVSLEVGVEANRIVIRRHLSGLGAVEALKAKSQSLVVKDLDNPL